VVQVLDREAACGLGRVGRSQLEKGIAANCDTLVLGEVLVLPPGYGFAFVLLQLMALLQVEAPFDLGFALEQALPALSYGPSVP
jgi:hypothetical protein